MIKRHPLAAAAGRCNRAVFPDTHLLEVVDAASDQATPRAASKLVELDQGTAVQLVQGSGLIHRRRPGHRLEAAGCEAQRRKSCSTMRSRPASCRRPSNWAGRGATRSDRRPGWSRGEWFASMRWSDAGLQDDVGTRPLRKQGSRRADVGRGRARWSSFCRRRRVRSQRFRPLLEVVFFVRTKRRLDDPSGVSSRLLHDLRRNVRDRAAGTHEVGGHGRTARPLERLVVGYRRCLRAP